MNTTQKIMSAVAAIALILSITMMSFDFKAKQTIKGDNSLTSKRSIQWTFKGTNTSQILDVNYYEQGLPAPTGCGSGVNLPCIVNFSDDIVDEIELHKFLTAPGRIPGDVLALSPQTRN